MGWLLALPSLFSRAYPTRHTELELKTGKGSPDVCLTGSQKAENTGYLFQNTGNISLRQWGSFLVFKKSLKRGSNLWTCPLNRKNTDFGNGTMRFKSLLCHLANRCWASYLMSLGLPSMVHKPRQWQSHAEMECGSQHRVWSSAWCWEEQKGCPRAWLASAVTQPWRSWARLSL